MNKDLAKKFDKVYKKNAKRFFSVIRPKILRNMRQAEAGYIRNIESGERDNFEWIKEALDRTYKTCQNKYFYDYIIIQEKCFETAKLLDNRKMNKHMYKRLCHNIRKEEYLAWY